MNTPSAGKGDMADQKHSLGHLYKYFLNLDFILSVVVPAAVFYVFERYSVLLLGTVCVGVWCIGIITIQFMRSGRIDVFAAMTAIISIVSLLGTILSENPVYYLVSPIVENVIFLLIFLVSVLIGRPAVKVIAAYAMKAETPKGTIKEPMLRSPWSIVTLFWAVAYAIKALIRIALLTHTSYAIYFAVGSIYSNASDILLIIFSIWFVGRCQGNKRREKRPKHKSL